MLQNEQTKTLYSQQNMFVCIILTPRHAGALKKQFSRHQKQQQREVNIHAENYIPLCIYSANL